MLIKHMFKDHAKVKGVDERTRLFQTLPFIKFHYVYFRKSSKAFFLTTIYILGSVDRQFRHVHTLTFSEMQLETEGIRVMSGSPKVARGAFVQDGL
jgi:hypothetical protein